MLAEMACTKEGSFAAIWKFVYIAEAHAMDEWPVRSARFNRGRGPVVVAKQPTEAKERCDLAKKFARDFLGGIAIGENQSSLSTSSSGFELLVDDPELGDPFEKAYAPWPLRLYMLKDGVMQWIAEPRNCSFDDAVGELMTLLHLS